MKRTDFDALVEQTLTRTANLLIQKGAEYSSDADRLANFKRNAAKNGQTVLETWQTYWGKHVDSINSYIGRVKAQATYLALNDTMAEVLELTERLPLPGARSISDMEKLAHVLDPLRFQKRVEICIPHAMRDIEKELSEPIDGRLDDTINYALLGLALIQELRIEDLHNGPVGDSRP